MVRKSVEGMFVPNGINNRERKPDLKDYEYIPKRLRYNQKPREFYKTPRKFLENYMSRSRDKSKERSKDVVKEVKVKKSNNKRKGNKKTSKKDKTIGKENNKKNDNKVTIDKQLKE